MFCLNLSDTLMHSAAEIPTQKYPKYYLTSIMDLLTQENIWNMFSHSGSEFF